MPVPELIRMDIGILDALLALDLEILDLTKSWTVGINKGARETERQKYGGGVDTRIKGIFRKFFSFLLRSMIYLKEYCKSDCLRARRACREEESRWLSSRLALVESASFSLLAVHRGNESLYPWLSSLSSVVAGKLWGLLPATRWKLRTLPELEP